MRYLLIILLGLGCSVAAEEIDTTVPFNSGPFPKCPEPEEDYRHVLNSEALWECELWPPTVQEQIDELQEQAEQRADEDITTHEPSDEAVAWFMAHMENWEREQDRKRYLEGLKWSTGLDLTELERRIAVLECYHDPNTKWGNTSTSGDITWEPLDCPATGTPLPGEGE